MAARPNPFILCLATAVSVVCGALGAISLGAALTRLPYDAAVDLLRQRRDIPEKMVAATATASMDAGRLIERGRYFSDAALSASQLDGRAQSTALQGQPLRAVIDEALMASPASPQNWVRRAQWQLAAGDLAGARVSLDTSLAFGRYVPGMTVSRLALILDLLKRQPDDQLAAAFDAQVRIAAVLEPPQLARLAADDAGTDGRIQRVLLDDFQLYRRYLHEIDAYRWDRDHSKRKAAS